MTTADYLARKSMLQNLYRDIMKESVSQLFATCQSLGIQNDLLYRRLNIAERQLDDSMIEEALANVSYVRLLLARIFNPLIGEAPFKEMPQDAIGTQLNVVFACFAEYANTMSRLDEQFIHPIVSDSDDPDDDSAATNGRPLP